MYQYHGWARLVVDHDVDDDDLDAWEAAEDALLVDLEQHRASLETITRNSVHVHPRTNGLLAISMAGVRNHYDPQVVNLLWWIAARAPRSYGLLYEHDFEDLVHPDVFRVFRLARGRVDDLDDTYLTPLGVLNED